MELRYVTDDMVRDLKVTDTPIKGVYTNGYGDKIPTRYMLQVGNRWHRVYVVNWGNSGSAYVVLNKARHYLAPEVEHALQAIGA